MKELEIEWKHLDVDGKTCDRCAGTGDEIHQFINRLHEECAGKEYETIPKRLIREAVCKIVQCC